jgi:hypothetical protein
MEHVCPNPDPKIVFDRGYRTFCCEQHSIDYVNYLNNKKNNKLSKSQQKDKDE